MGDMGAAGDVALVAAEARDRFGRIDTLVNNAARRPHKPVFEMTEADWTGVVDVALTGSFRTAQAFLPGMVAQAGGVSSTSRA